MHPSTRTFVAALSIFLILSMNPIEARRTVEARTAVEGLSAEALRLEKVMLELQEALAEDRTGGMAEHQGRSWRGSGHLAARGHASGWWCNSKRASFERHSLELQEKVEALKARDDSDEPPSFADTAHVVLEARKLVKSLDSARSWGCAWVTDGSVKTAPFEQLVAIAIQGNKCFATGHALIVAAQNGTASEQEMALSDAIGLMLSTSDDCEPVNANVTVVVPEAMEDEVEAEEAAEALAHQAGLPESEVSGEEGSEPAVLPEEGSASLMQLAGHSSRAAFITPIDVFIYAVVGFLAVVVLALACTIAVTLLVLLFGFIFCTLRTVILKLLSVVKNVGKFSFKGCAYVLWRQTVGWGIKENNDEQYSLFKKGGGLKLIEATCAVPAIAVVASTMPFALPGAALR